MTYHEFYKKLSPFFTSKQINNLNSIALDEAQTAISDPGELIAFDSDKHDAGRDYVCILLSVRKKTQSRESNTMQAARLRLNHSTRYVNRWIMNGKGENKMTLTVQWYERNPDFTTNYDREHHRNIHGETASECMSIFRQLGQDLDLVKFTPRQIVNVAD